MSSVGSIYRKALGGKLMKSGKPVIAIIGSRKYKNKTMMFEILDGLLSVEKDVYSFISGGANGPDIWAEEWCDLHDFEFKEYPILPGEHPFDRNSRVALAADCIIAFVSLNQFRSGTWNTISEFRKLDKRGYYVYDQNGSLWDRKWKE
jgi:hypothetical protein